MSNSVVCDGRVPCESVFKELKTKTPLNIFMWIMGGMGAALLLIALVVYNNQSTTWEVLTMIQSDVKVIQAEVKHLGRRNRRISK